MRRSIRDKRKAIPIRVIEDPRIYARYQGLINRHIAISTGALRAWHQPVIDAVYMHEVGHHMLYHAELHVGMLSGIALMAISGAWNGNLLSVPAAFAVHVLWRLWLEIQADRFSKLNGFDMAWAVDEHLALRLSPWMRLQLKIRQLCLKAS